MGFFSRSKIKENIVGCCFICNTPIIEKVDEETRKISDKAEYILSDCTCICPICANQKGILNKNIFSKSKDDVLSQFKDNGLSTPEEFSPSKRIIKLCSKFNDVGTNKAIWSYFEIDEQRQLINFPSYDFSFFGKTKYREHIHPVADLLDFELLDNGNKIIDGGSLLGATVGGLVFGGAGAIVGSGLKSKKITDECTSLSIKLVFDDMNNSTEYIHIIGDDSNITKVKRDSQAFKDLYATAQECLSIFTILLKKNENPVDSNTAASLPSQHPESNIIDTIKKLGELKEQGIITIEEFESKKSELLARL